MTTTIKRVLEAKTAADQSDEFDVTYASRQSSVVTVMVAGLAGAETATLQMKDWAGAWKTVATQDFDGDFTALLSTVSIVGPGTYRVDKGVTAGAVAVDVSL